MVLHKQGDCHFLTEVVYLLIFRIYQKSVKQVQNRLIGVFFILFFNQCCCIFIQHRVWTDRLKYLNISLRRQTRNAFSLEKKRILLEVDQPYANHNGGHLGG